MRYLVVLLLSGCAYNATLYPRGGGDIARGTVNTGSKEMVVSLDGSEFRGSYVRGYSVGYGFANTYGSNPQFASGVSMGASNQYAATLTNGKTALRCEFMAERSGGNGVCVDSANRVYDLVLEKQ
jgi:hypothetical protein